jgi:hypothetical protein
VDDFEAVRNLRSRLTVAFAKCHFEVSEFKNVCNKRNETIRFVRFRLTKKTNNEIHLVRKLKESDCNIVDGSRDVRSTSSINQNPI